MKKLLLSLVIIVCMFLILSCGNNNDNEITTTVHQHTAVVIEAIEPTCTENGYTEGSYCSECNEQLIIPEEIPATGHSVYEDERVESTCKDKGLTVGYHCGVCGEVLQKQEELPLKEHTYTDEYDEFCNVCGFERDALCAHLNMEIIPGKDSTCHEIGYTDGFKCQKCGEILTAQEVIDKKEHIESDKITVIAPTKTEDGTYYTECTLCGDKMSEGILHATGSLGLKYRFYGGYAIVTGLGDCTDTEIIIPEYYSDRKVTEIDASAFLQCWTITSVTMPDSITYIGTSAFQECSKLKTIKMSNSLEVINSKTFFGCSSLESIDIPDTVTDIRELAFSGCKQITSLILPNSLEYIGIQAFSSMSITSVVIPASVTQIDGAPFIFCESLVNIQVEPGNPQFTSISGDLYYMNSSNKLELVQYAVGKQERVFALPQNVSVIWYRAFAGNDFLVEIILSDSVELIGSEGFAFCSALEIINIPASVYRINDNAFKDCYKLTSVTFENLNGWKLNTNLKAEYGWVELSSTNLLDPSNAAKYLKDNYLKYFWCTNK